MDVVFKSLVVLVLLTAFHSPARADHTDSGGYQFAGGSAGAATGAALGWGGCRLVFSETNESDVTAVRVSAAAGQTLLCIGLLMGGTAGGAYLGGKLDRPASDHHWDEARGWQLNAAVHGSYTGPLLAYAIAGLGGDEAPGGLTYGASTVAAAAVAYGAGAFAQWLNPTCGARGYSVASTMGSMLNVIIGIPVAALVDSDRLSPKAALGMAVTPMLLGAVGSIFCS